MPWLLLVALLLALTLFFGAPFVPSKRNQLDDLFKWIAQNRVGSKSEFVDLGAGTGTALVVAQRHGFQVVGYEINPILWLIGWLRVRKNGGRMYFRPWQSGNLRSADIVYIFTSSHFTSSAAFSKIPGSATVVSLGFELEPLATRPKKSYGPYIIYLPQQS